MKALIKKIAFRVIDRFVSFHKSYRDELIYKNFDIDRSVRFWELSVEGNVRIGEQTYLNDHCRIDSGKNSKVEVGAYCAIGRRVHITSKTHSMVRPTRSENCDVIEHEEKDTVIGAGVWIGDSVLVNKGVQIGDYAIIGANSVVNRDVKPFEIVGGVPARHIRFNEMHHKYSR